LTQSESEVIAAGKKQLFWNGLDNWLSFAYPANVSQVSHGSYVMPSRTLLK